MKLFAILVIKSRQFKKAFLMMIIGTNVSGGLELFRWEFPIVLEQ